jgi:PIN domain nuclease of toxin-antitoxin system
MILLDTHVALWWRENNPRLEMEAREAIASADVAYVSVVSAWEVAVKIAVGKLRIPGSFEEAIDESGFSKLPITFAHAAALTELPLHHRDPFDRMLIVQAQQEGLTIVTADRKFEPYDVDILWT